MAGIFHAHFTNAIPGGLPWQKKPTATTTDNNSQVEATNTVQMAEDPQPRSEESFQQEIKKLRQENAKFRTERNELREDAEKYRQQQDAEKNELQRAQSASAKYQLELARAQALAKSGISEENADLLGGDPEKFEANAQRIGQLQEAATKRGAPPSDMPVEDLKSGASDAIAKADVSYPASWPVHSPFAGTQRTK